MTELPTYTSVFRLQRRLYAIYDWELPVPVGLLEAGVFLGGVGLFTLIAGVLGIGFTTGSAWFFVVPPGFMAYAARKPFADGKQPHAWFAAQVRYALEPRAVVDLADPVSPRRSRAGSLPAVAVLDDEVPLDEAPPDETVLPDVDPRREPEGGEEEADEPEVGEQEDPVPLRQERRPRRRRNARAADPLSSVLDVLDEPDAAVEPRDARVAARQQRAAARAAAREEKAAAKAAAREEKAAAKAAAREEKAAAKQARQVTTDAASDRWEPTGGRGSGERVRRGGPVAAPTRNRPNRPATVSAQPRRRRGRADLPAVPSDPMGEDAP